LNLENHQDWLIDFYKRHGWYHFSPFVHVNFLTEETGEVARAVRALEIGRHHPGEKPQTPAEKTANLKEELADVLDQVLILSAKFGIDPETLLDQSETKLSRRFNENRPH
jgi:NTP pyrophosphatase (non-canonical NTP hydrolase)